MFDQADWLINESEREAIGIALVQEFERARDAGDDELQDTLKREIAILQRCKAAPDRLVEQVDLFPLPGVTPGYAGLIVADSKWTTVITGDAVPTVEHLEAGQVLSNIHDVEAAQESMREVVEIADLLIPGRDGLLPNPLRRW